MQTLMQRLLLCFLGFDNSLLTDFSVSGRSQPLVVPTASRSALSKW